jgi:tetratricopeptide (TPR) repeat protein
VGALNFSLASKATNEAQIKTYREKAIKYLDQAVKLFPNYRQAHKNLARLYFQIGEDQYIDLALKHFAKSIELGDKEAATYILLSKLYFDRQLFVAAETAARQAIMMDPKIKESRTILAYSLFQQERYAEAQGVFKELLEDEPNNSDIWLMIGNTFLQDNRIDEAAQQLEIVRLMGKADSRTMSLLGDVYMNKSMVEDAKEAYSQSLKLAASESGGLKNPEEFISSVRSLNNYQEYELAMSLLNEVSDAFEGKLDDAKRNEILVLSSEINIALGQDAKAVEDLKGILDIDPLNGRALLSLGQYYSRLKTDDQAKRLEAVELALGFYRRAQDLIDLGREGDEETARQAYVGAGQLLAREKRLREALNALEEAQAILYQDRIANYIDMIRSVSSRNS